MPSASIMLRQPMQRFTQMQASDIDIYRNEIRKTKNEIVRDSFPLQLLAAAYGLLCILSLLIRFSGYA